MVKTGGVRSLWRGNGVNCIQVGPENALTFFFYETFKRLLLKDPEHPSAQEKFTCGALAGASSMSTAISQLRMFLLLSLGFVIDLIVFFFCLAIIYLFDSN